MRPAYQIASFRNGFSSVSTKVDGASLSDLIMASGKCGAIGTNMKQQQMKKVRGTGLAFTVQSIRGSNLT